MNEEYTLNVPGTDHARPDRDDGPLMHPDNERLEPNGRARLAAGKAKRLESVASFLEWRRSRPAAPQRHPPQAN